MVLDRRAVCPFTSDTILEDAACGCESTGDCKEPEGQPEPQISKMLGPDGLMAKVFGIGSKHESR